MSKSARKITEEEHGELCAYIEEQLSIYHALQREFNSNKSRQEYAKRETYYNLICDTLSDLIADDAVLAGL